MVEKYKSKLNDRIFQSLFFFLILCLLLGQLTRISLYNQKINFTFFDIGVGLMVGYFFIRYRLSPFFQKSNLPVVLFGGWVVISYMVNIASYDLLDNIVAVFYSLRLFGLLSLFVYFRFHFMEEKESFSQVIWPLRMFVICFSLVSLVQYFLYPNLRNLQYLGWDPHQYRLFGSYLEPVIAGTMAVLILFLIWREKIFSSKLTTSFVSSVLLVIIALTFSRNIYISLILSVGFLTIWKKNWKLLIFFVVFFLGLLLIIPKPFGEGVNLWRQYSITSRMTNYKEGWQIFLKKPVFGVGYNHLREARKSSLFDSQGSGVSHAGASFDSSYLLILTTLGLPGLLLFFYLLSSFFLLECNSSLLLASSLFFLIISSFFDNLLLHPMVVGFSLISISLPPLERREYKRRAVLTTKDKRAKEP